MKKKTGEAVEAIRLALACEEFAKAQSLWTEHAGQLRQAILEGSATQAMLSETGELIGWSRLVVQAFRAHAVDQLNGARLLEVYSCPTPERPHVVRATF